MTDRDAGAQKRSSVDELTQVHRRGPGLLLLDRQIQRAQSRHESLIVAFINVNGSLAVDREKGHLAEDEVLRVVAEALRSTLRSSDLVTRYSGDKFIVSMSGTPRPQVEQTFAAFAHALAGGTGSRTVTVGYAEMSPTDTAHAIINRADASLRSQGPAIPLGA